MLGKKYVPERQPKVDHYHPCDRNIHHRTKCFVSKKKCDRNEEFTCMPCLSIENQKRRAAPKSRPK